MKTYSSTRTAHITVFLGCLTLVAPQLVAAPAAAKGSEAQGKHSKAQGKHSKAHGKRSKAKGKRNKVQVCHVPPGNPDNFHTITVSEKALAAHLRRGSFEGPCGNFCEILCDDGNFCTIDACDSDEACVHEPVDCNDGNSCTADSCEPASGCVASPLLGNDCTVDDGNACTTPEGVCDAGGACVPAAVPDCCNTDGECADDDLCTFEACVGNACVPNGETSCETDDCTVSVCHPATGQCTDPEPVVCEELECHANGCAPEGGCFSIPIPGCCVSDAECDDGNNCTTDTCFGPDGCASTPCATGDTCNTLIDCDAATCAPITEPVSCSDDGNACTAESCVPGQGCVSTPVGPFPGGETECADGVDNDCDGLTDTADPDCFADCPCAGFLPASGWDGEITGGGAYDGDCADGSSEQGSNVERCDASNGFCLTTAQDENINCQGIDNLSCTVRNDAGAVGSRNNLSLAEYQGCRSLTQIECTPSPEVCDDGFDNDCDGSTDAADGDCAPPPAESSCNNDLDDDGDGLVDCADPDCAGELYCQCPCFTPGEARAQLALCQSIYDSWAVFTLTDESDEGDQYRLFTCFAQDSNGQPLPGAEQLEIGVDYRDFGQRQNFCFMEELQSDEDNFRFLQNNDTTACAAAFDAF